jgi:type II secretory ATPase GspE/PulE/Tfp pilus assembly ATPase PilB-like protein
MTVATGFHSDEPREPTPQEPLGQILKRMELVTEAQIQEALKIQKERGGVIGEILVALGYVSREEVLMALAVQMRMEVVDLAEMPPGTLKEALEQIREESQTRYELRFEKVEGERGPRLPTDDLANSAPVVKLVNLILTTAQKAGATEVRFEALGNTFSVRYRVEGVLYDMESPPFHLAAPMIGRLLSECGMDVSRRKEADEGRVRLRGAGWTREATVHYRRTHQGESVIFTFSKKATG